MKNPELLEFSGDGYIEIDGCTGVISRCAFPAEDTEDLFVYHLFHPNRHNLYRWALELITLDTPEIDCGFGYGDDIPEEAYVYFAQEPEFDYISFDEDDMDANLNWNPDVTIGDLFDMLQEE